MSQEIEIEFKNLVEENEYHKLMNAFNLKQEDLFSQTNHYFETNDHALKSHKAALRIRKKNDTWTLTLKEPHPEGLLETHDTLTEEEARAWMNNTPTDAPHVMKRLNALQVPVSSLRYLGALTTERIEVPYNETTVVLDKSLYNGQSDYELELEASEKQHGSDVFHSLLSQYDIPKRETPNKIQRFYNSLSETE
ncbi:adenylate cyclase [Pontibacillus halophilus JSM 076056 = DSM 19796]|uniref:Adenylate cyclase n=1 Tax=Pontibacillus halophilus JSM 076056 = DSM 19796 TaxID=1385510 RepID=A0A0A5GL35_9BACI|nr:CYTH domain-containing protein [Pontibacillus halophilus]KGX92704.1 adenylate cyclase [Pontibacillus halophilus JSM 076056 = DSM 19796]